MILLIDFSSVGGAGFAREIPVPHQVFFTLRFYSIFGAAAGFSSSI
jgi:hypothetical protein